jgi:outer membrane protein OmpA-like peptidoglycan-associated protein
MKTVLFLLLIHCVSTANSQLQTVNIYFDKMSSEIRPEGMLELEKLAILIQADSTVIQSISAYSDTLGTLELNARLAKERFNNSLKVLGIQNNDNYFEANIYGEEFPFVASEYNIELFRRVTIVHFVKEEVIAEVSVEEVVKEVDNDIPSTLLMQLEQFSLNTTKEEMLLQLSILFVGDTDVFLNSSTPELEELQQFLKKNKNIDIHIRGHVCCIPNNKLSKERAKRVYEYLVQNSIKANRLSYKGYSNKSPLISPELSETDRQGNRRVDIILKKD